MGYFAGNRAGIIQEAYFRTESLPLESACKASHDMSFERDVTLAAECASSKASEISTESLEQRVLAQE